MRGRDQADLLEELRERQATLTKLRSRGIESPLAGGAAHGEAVSIERLLELAVQVGLSAGRGDD